MVSTASHTNRHFVKSHIFEIIYFCFWMIYYIFYLSQLSSACQTWQISKNQIRTLSIGNANYFRNLGKVMLYENKESCLRHSSVGIFFFFFWKTLLLQYKHMNIWHKNELFIFCVSLKLSIQFSAIFSSIPTNIHT